MLKCRNRTLLLLSNLVWLSLFGLSCDAKADKSPHMITNTALLNKPQWTTSSRLLKQGETINFCFFKPEEIKESRLDIFLRYLEQANPGNDYVAGGDLNWLEKLPSETIDLPYHDNKASLEYTPKQPGNYIARWQVGDEQLYRYFSVIDDSFVVIRYGGYHELNMEPMFNSAGIPIDLPLPVEKYHPGDAVFDKYINYHRTFGYALVPQYPDTPDISQEERKKLYAGHLDNVRNVLPDINDARCGRVEMWHENEPGYTKVFSELGINSHFGLQMSNGCPFLGMPEFPYFAAPLDIRKANRDQAGDVVCHQWDFCGGWHFLGPLSWHYRLSFNEWPTVEKSLRQGIKEGANLAKLSRYPAFLFPLYDGNIFGDNENGRNCIDFIERYQQFIAFKATKEYKVVFSRAIDIADYYIRHFKKTPRTIFVSKTDNIFYEMNWHNIWAGQHLLQARERLPWWTRISTIMQLRESIHAAKDPMSYEYIVFEDGNRSIRFERESPNPIWWSDYTNPQQDVTEKGSMIRHWVKTPDVDVVEVAETEAGMIGGRPRIPKWQKENGTLKIKMKMLTKAEFNDYAIALWGLPEEFARDPDPVRIKTNAKEFAIARNTDGEYHLILVFDLKPDLLLKVELPEAKQ